MKTYSYQKFSPFMCFAKVLKVLFLKPTCVLKCFLGDFDFYNIFGIIFYRHDAPDN